MDRGKCLDAIRILCFFFYQNGNRCWFNLPVYIVWCSTSSHRLRDRFVLRKWCVQLKKKNARTLCTISWVSRLLLAINHTQFFCRMHRHSKQKYVVAWLIFQYRTACTPWARWLHSVLVFWLAFFVLAALFPLACCCTNAYLYGEPRSNCGDDVHDLS